MRGLFIFSPQGVVSAPKRIDTASSMLAMVNLLVFFDRLRLVAL